MASGLQAIAKVSRKMEHVEDEEDEEIALLHCMQAATAGAIPHAMHNAIQLGLPEMLVNAGCMLTPVQIAERIAVPKGTAKADPGNVERILRLLSSSKLLKETLTEKNGTIERRFGANASTKYFIDADEKSKSTGIQGSLVGWLKLCLSANELFPVVYKSVLDPSKEAQSLVHGIPMWEYYATNPKEGEFFKTIFANYCAITVPLIIAKYDGFKTAKTLVDVGGGLGVNVGAVVAKYPHIHGINFDLPFVVKDAPHFPGVEHVGGSFLEKIPDCDTAYMKMILHDWDDEVCTTILKTIHKALPEDGKLINVDAVLSEPFDDSLLSKTNLALNYSMMAVCTGGRERTLSEFQRLGAAAGFHRVIVAQIVDRFTILEFYKK